MPTPVFTIDFNPGWTYVVESWCKNHHEDHDNHYILGPHDEIFQFDGCGKICPDPTPESFPLRVIKGKAPAAEPTHVPPMSSTEPEETQVDDTAKDTEDTEDAVTTEAVAASDSNGTPGMKRWMDAAEKKKVKTSPEVHGAEEFKVKTFESFNNKDLNRSLKDQITAAYVELQKADCALAVKKPAEAKAKPASRKRKAKTVKTEEHEGQDGQDGAGAGEEEETSAPVAPAPKRRRGKKH
eukprot:s532_g25.t1